MGWFPSCQLNVTRLRESVPQSMEFREPRIRGVSLVDAKLLDVAAVRWNERSPARHSVGTLEHFALLRCTYRYHSRLTTLGPARFERQVIALVGSAWAELHGLLTSEPESLLELKTHSDVGIADFLEVHAIQTFRFAS